MKDKVVIVLISTALLIVLGLGIYGIINQNNNDSGQNIPIPEVTVSTSTSDAVVNNQSQITANMKHLITIKTNYGTIEFGTYDNDAPKTAQNFITLA